jgi:superfamily II DNA/RNA helicase
VADKLRQAGVPAAALHGAQSSGRRAQALDDLAAGHIGVLVATDLAARGLDITGLEAVVQYDLPRSAADHTHRIGRTARAGAPGTAVSFVCADMPGSESHFRLIEKRHRLRLPRETWPGFEPHQAASPAPSEGPGGHTALAVDRDHVADAPRGLDPAGGIKGRRPSRKDQLRAALAATPRRPR